MQKSTVCPHKILSKTVSKFNTILLRHRTFLKSAIDGISSDYFIVGLYASGDRVKTNNGEVGKISDFSGDHELTVNSGATDVIVKAGYVLANKVVSPGAFICQHD